MSEQRRGPNTDELLIAASLQGGYAMAFVGWDWASEIDDITVLSDDGTEVLDRWVMRHDETGIRDTLDRLASHGDPGEVPIAIETTSGLVVDRLLAAGHQVVPIHPNAFKAARARWGMSGSKSDPGDSYKLADFVRTDGHRLRRLEPLDPVAGELQALSRLRDDHMAAKLAATNQLSALLDRHWPGANALFQRLDSRIGLAFLSDYPTPRSARHLGVGTMTKFCRRHSYTGQRTADELVQRLRAAPHATESINKGVLKTLIEANVAVIAGFKSSIAELDKALIETMAKHSKAVLLAPMPRIGVINLAQIVAEVGPIIARAVDAEHAAAEIGASPVTRESGKHRSVHFRWAVNTRARKALATFADNSRHSSPWAAGLYAQARARGKRHPHAIRILMRAWLRVIWACWHNNTPYNPQLHATGG